MFRYGYYHGVCVFARSEPPESAAFNADAHPDHPSVELLDNTYGALEIEATLREYRADVGLASE